MIDIKVRLGKKDSMERSLLTHQAEIKLGYVPDSIQKLRIIYRFGRCLEEFFKRRVYLHEGYGIYIIGYQLNDYANSGFYGSSYVSSYVRLDFMDFLFFFLDILNEREDRIQFQVKGKFKIVVPSSNIDVPIIEKICSHELPSTLQIGFPAIFDRDRIKLQAQYLRAGDKLSFKDYLVDLIREFEENKIDLLVEPRRGKWCDLKSVEISFLLRAMRNYSLKELFEILCGISPMKNEVEYLASTDIPRYKEDRKLRLISSILEFEKRFTSKRAKRKLKQLKDRASKENVESFIDSFQNIEDEKLERYEKDRVALYL